MPFKLFFFLNCLSISILSTLATNSKGPINFISSIFFLTIVLYLSNFFKVTKILISIPVIVLYFMIFPAGYIYGDIDLGVISSIKETNIPESREFLTTVSFSVYLYMVVFFLLIFLYFKENTFNSSVRKVVVFSTILLCLFLSKTPSFYKHIVSSYIEYENDTLTLKEELKEKPIWRLEKYKNKYENHVVIIGESMRRDYMSLYGYSINTTPFLRKTPSIVLDNYISASANTANSLPRTLSLVQNEKIKFQYNIITLANAADFNTTWISNQGFIGKYDTAISKIAIYSHNKVFLKKGGFRSKNTNDLELLPFFDKELKRESKKPKLIVLHLMGSHPNFCDRIKKDIYNFKDKKLSCYLSSYAQTDFLIKSVIESLKRNEKTYSLVYFSDHGLNNNGTRDNVRLMHGASFKSNYEIPFIEISSDMKEEKHIKNEISAFDFMGFFEGWINVKTDKIPTFSILSKDNHSQVKVFNYHEMVTFDNLKSDPPILSPKK